jgi:hypothetical protein
MNKKNKGFTLIEFLLYSIIVTATTGALILIGVNIMRVSAKVTVVEEVNYNGKMIVDEIASYIRKSDSIAHPSSGEESDYLTLEMNVDANSPVIFTKDEETEMLVMQIGDDLFSTMNSNLVKIGEIKFSNVSYPNSPGTVKMEIDVVYNNQTGKEEYDFQETFYTTENLRIKEVSN